MDFYIRINILRYTDNDSEFIMIYVSQHDNYTTVIWDTDFKFVTYTVLIATSISDSILLFNLLSKIVS